ncbi:hypothetical protein [uncultured Pontibacter sp.]|uniref:hypothetical protein n=1 Tax=uncultured Pontibacter sp. TaxID=453356 RepID=UPI00261DA21A|nr:hypothetical protein [uncultured Pontibacter sp.]
MRLYQELKKEGHDEWEEVNLISNPYTGDNKFVTFTMAEITKNALDELLQELPDMATFIQMKWMAKYSENRQVYEPAEGTREKINTFIDFFYTK